MSGGKVVAWVELTPNGKIAFFDGKPMVMVGLVGNEHHTTPLVLQSDLAAAIARAEADAVDAQAWRQWCEAVGADQVAKLSEKFGDALGLVRDAARYRGMRSVALSERLDLVPPVPGEKTPDTFDAWIDAAIAAQQAEGEDRG